MLVLGHSLVMQANDYMFLLKQEAAKGNTEAKKVYEQLYPSYRAALEEENLGSGTDELKQFFFPKKPEPIIITPIKLLLCQHTLSSKLP